MNSLKELRAEWKSVYGTDIPPHIARLPLIVIDQALEHGRRKFQQPISETLGNDDSLMFVDTHKQH
ncbi:MAG: hypothetical protein E6Q97_33755 [Desulfurellales bacterium]|nr:MAG: hypothetical protein E6Q97_33755 [Desulfurellales bacterium]